MLARSACFSISVSTSCMPLVAKRRGVETTGVSFFAQALARVPQFASRLCWCTAFQSLIPGTAPDFQPTRSPNFGATLEDTEDHRLRGDSRVELQILETGGKGRSAWVSEGSLSTCFQQARQTPRKKRRVEAAPETTCQLCSFQILPFGVTCATHEETGPNVMLAKTAAIPRVCLIRLPPVQELLEEGEGQRNRQSLKFYNFIPKNILQVLPLPYGAIFAFWFQTLGKMSQCDCPCGTVDGEAQRRRRNGGGSCTSVRVHIHVAIGLPPPNQTYEPLRLSVLPAADGLVAQ